MKPLFVLDLEGTTGIYSSSEHINDMTLFRPGFRDIIRRNNQGSLNMAIATRAPKHFTDEIQENLRKQGIKITCPILTKEDVQYNEAERMSYKNYNKLWNHFELGSPEEHAIIIGDFLRFPLKTFNFMDTYLRHDFSRKKRVLYENCSLNDHPLPTDEKPTPLYGVVCQPWITFKNKINVALDINYVVNFIENLYSKGGENFQEGFNSFPGTNEVQKTTSVGLAREDLGFNHHQKYLIFKGKENNWKPLERII